MGEHDFQIEVLHQLGEISGIQKSMQDELRTQQTDIKKVQADATKAADSAKSAHHRINLIMMMLGAVAMVLIGIIVKILGL